MRINKIEIGICGFKTDASTHRIRSMSVHWCRSLEILMYNLTPLHLSTKFHLTRRNKQRHRHRIKTVLKRGRACLPFITRRGVYTETRARVMRGDGSHPLNRTTRRDVAVSFREDVVNPTHSGRSLVFPLYNRPYSRGHAFAYIRLIHKSAVEVFSPRSEFSEFSAVANQTFPLTARNVSKQDNVFIHHKTRHEIV